MNKRALVLFALIVLIAAGNFTWLKTNTTPPVGNGLQDLFPAINFYSDLLHKQFEPPGVFAYIRNRFHIYPPLVPISYTILYFFFRPGLGLELMANTFYLAIALFSIYGIGRKIYNQKAGLLAAFIFSSFLGVISISRKVYAEFNLMCLTALAFYLLLATDYFRNRARSFLLGICLGLLALTKWEFLLVLTGPFILTVWQSSRITEGQYYKNTARSRPGINLLIVIAVAALIASFWYIPSFEDIFHRLFVKPDENIFQYNRTTFEIKSLSLRAITYYLLAIINSHLGLFYFLSLVFLAAVFIYRKFKNQRIFSQEARQRFYVRFFSLWIIIPYISFTLIKIQAPSHIMVVLPAIALIISFGILSLKNKFALRVCVSLIILYGCLAHLHSFWAFKGAEDVFNLKVALDKDNRLKLTTRCTEQPRDCWEINSFNSPDARDWKIRDILFFIRENSRGLGRKPTILVLGGWRLVDKFNFASFQYYNLLENYNLYIEPRGNDRSSFPQDRSYFDYVVTFVPQEMSDRNKAELAMAIHSTRNIVPAHKITDFQEGFFKNYHLIGEYVLPDNESAKIYKIKSRHK